MLRESVTYVIARNEEWSGACATEPVEAGWASEAVFFIRALKPVQGEMPRIKAQLSPDGMRWADEGSSAPMPSDVDDLQVLRISHFGNWLRLTVELADDAATTVLIAVHLK